jgi:hypothetical protein
MLSEKLSRLLFLLVLTTALASFALADTIRFKDGTIIKGHITNFSGGKFIVEIGEGARRKELAFSIAEIESIAFDARSPQTSNTSNVPAVYSKPAYRPEVTSSRPVVTNPPKSASPAVTVKAAEPPLRQPAARSNVQPAIKWNKRVAADNSSNGWANTGWVVKKGQRIRITGEGNISLGKGQTSPASGIAELDDPQKLLKSVPTGALIAVIGDDNNDFIYIGAEREFTAARDGALFLGVNEGDLSDDSGAFDVTVEILPESGS